MYREKRINPSIGYMCSTKILELALHNGFDPLTKKQIGPKTGEAKEFQSIQDVMEAYQKQQTYFMEVWMRAVNKVISMHAQILPTVFASGLIEGCVEQGKLLQQGGAKYRITATSLNGFANTVDSFAAMDVLVFQEKKLTMEQLLWLLDSNFEGEEAMRQMLLN